MQHVVKFCWWLCSWWMEQANWHTAITPHLQEGLIAYASEMAEREEHWQVLWATAWAGIHEHAQLVLSKHLNGSDDGEEVWIPLHRVEIDVEDEEEFVDDLSEAE